MKNFDLASMGVHEMSTLEMKETDGGIIWVLVVAGLVLLGTSSCKIDINTNIGGQNNTITSPQSMDKSFNGNSADSTLNGNSIKPIILP